MNNNKVYQIDKMKRKKKNKRRDTFRRLIFFITLFCLISILVVILFLKSPQQIAITQYDSIIDGFNTKALIVRDEKVVSSPFSGKLYPLQQEGSRISQGCPVVRIINDSTQEKVLYNQKAGIISYSIDGLEQILSPASSYNLNISKFEEFSRNYNYINKGSNVNTGQPAYRLVNNFEMYLVIKTTQKEIARYYINEKVFIRDLENGREMIEGKVKDKITDSNNKKGLMIIKLDRFIRRWLSKRWVKIKFIKNIHRGIVIPNQAIINNSGKPQVVIKNIKGYNEVKTININFKGKEKSVVEGINTGYNVLINPDKKLFD